MHAAQGKLGLLWVIPAERGGDGRARRRRERMHAYTYTCTYTHTYRHAYRHAYVSKHAFGNVSFGWCAGGGVCVLVCVVDETKTDAVPRTRTPSFGVLGQDRPRRPEVQVLSYSD